MGKYKIRFLQDADAQNFEKTMVFQAGNGSGAECGGKAWWCGRASCPMNAVIRVLSGAAAGREVALHRVVTTVGKPGVAVASITKRIQGFVLAHVEGPDMPLLNGVAIGSALSRSKAATSWNSRAPKCSSSKPDRCDGLASGDLPGLGALSPCAAPCCFAAGAACCSR